MYAIPPSPRQGISGCLQVHVALRRVSSACWATYIGLRLHAPRRGSRFAVSRRLPPSTSSRHCQIGRAPHTSPPPLSLPTEVVQAAGESGGKQSCGGAGYASLDCGYSSGCLRLYTGTPLSPLHRPSRNVDVPSDWKAPRRAIALKSPFSYIILYAHRAPSSDPRYSPRALLHRFKN